MTETSSMPFLFQAVCWFWIIAGLLGMFYALHKNKQDMKKNRNAKLS